MKKRRPRINTNLVATSSLSKTKIDYARKNRKSSMSGNTVYMMQLFGEFKQISKDDFERLKKTGYCVVAKEKTV